MNVSKFISNTLRFASLSQEGRESKRAKKDATVSLSVKEAARVNSFISTWHLLLEMQGMEYCISFDSGDFSMALVSVSERTGAFFNGYKYKSSENFSGRKSQDILNWIISNTIAKTHLYEFVPEFRIKNASNQITNFFQTHPDIYNVIKGFDVLLQKIALQRAVALNTQSLKSEHKPSNKI